MRRIRPLTLDDVPAAVHVHLAAFPSFFLSMLGSAFLRELYRGFARSPTCVALVAEEDNRVCGAIVGTTMPQAFFKALLLRRWWAFGLAACGQCLRHPSAIPRLVRAVRYRGGGAALEPGRALLSSIAVDTESQGRGFGRDLVSAWLECVRAKGAVGCYLTTDADGNEAVNRFYQRHGWTLESTFITPEGRKMNRYVYDF